MTEANIEIRQAVPSDAQAIAAIHVASWRAAYANLMPAAYLAGLSVERRILDWRNALESRRLHVALARDADGIAGWIAYGKCRDSDKDATWAEIEALYLHPARYGQGIGALLIEHACAALAKMGYAQVSLWVLVENKRARTFYERAGFEHDERIKTFELGGAQLAETRYRHLLG